MEIEPSYEFELIMQNSKELYNAMIDFMCDLIESGDFCTKNELNRVMLSSSYLTGIPRSTYDEIVSKAHKTMREYKKSNDELERPYKTDTFSIVIQKVNVRDRNNMIYFPKSFRLEPVEHDIKEEILRVIINWVQPDKYYVEIVPKSLQRSSPFNKKV